MKNKRIAIINQRYGREVNGGSEYYTKKLAEHLNQYYQVEVLTTTALDYDQWKPYYEPGEEMLDGVLVRRFAVRKPRNICRFRLINGIMTHLPMAGKKLFQKLWLREQGPYCPELIQYIENHRNDYDAFLFVTYLYYTTAAGIEKCPEKAILIPTAHDEYCIYFPMYRKVFQSPRGIVYLTQAEEDFAEEMFSLQNKPHVIAGAGIEVPETPNTEQAYRTYGIKEEYVIYVGRIDTGKNCQQLFQFFEKYKEENPGPLKLILVGKLMLEDPAHSDIKCLGYISEEDKYGLMTGAKALILPSEFESLSLSVLESMALGVPVLVNGKCQVLKQHCEKSQGGFYYTGYEEFAKYLSQLVTDGECQNQMGNAATDYVQREYSWEKTVDMYRMLIEG